MKAFMIALFLILLTLPYTDKLFTMYGLPVRPDGVAMDNATSDRMGRIIWKAQKDFKVQDSWGY
jgi:hypothetical protein